jgi:hypothetical protein
MKHGGIIIPPSVPGSPTGTSPDPRRNLPVVSLIGNKRYYGEVPARLRGGYGPVSGNPPQNSAIRAGRNFRIIGTCPVPTAGSADITSLYVAEFGAVPAGKRLFVQASTMVNGFESLPRQFQARVPAA